MGCLVNSFLSSLCWWAWASTIRGLNRQPGSSGADVDIHMNYNMLVRFRTLTLTGRQRPPVPSITRCVRRRNCCSSSNMSVNMTTGGSSSKSAPIIREFVDVEGGDIRSRGQSDGIRFRLVSYNILAQAYVKSSLFPHSPSPSLRWKDRSQAILTLLKNLGADFFCLQWMSMIPFTKETWRIMDIPVSMFREVGRSAMDVEFFSRTTDLLLDETSLSADKQNETLADGNNGAHAKNDSPVKSSPECRGDPNDPHVRLKRDCVGIMAAFRLKDPFHHVVILANTHLYWDPEWADVKLAQAKYLLSRLAQFKTLVTDKFECTPSLILSGDFNSTPGDKVYQYLISGNSSSASLMTCLEELPFPLCSVHAFTRGEPPFTNCTPDFTNTLDYIFFSPSDCLKPVSILELPELDSPDVVGGLPNYSHPSDHLPIGAEFEITKE
ncbi:Endonuclease/exonuclease/phosphatase - like 9 [Theobroma cacao]|nr:Endonuclease/exonuclease/phosphatase - like 9 [Theobroma cacao]